MKWRFVYVLNTKSYIYQIMYDSKEGERLPWFLSHKIYTNILHQWTSITTPTLPCRYFCGKLKLWVVKNKGYLQRESYDLLITDMSFENPRSQTNIENGQELIAATKTTQRTIKVIVFSVEDDPSTIKTLFENQKIKQVIDSLPPKCKEIILLNKIQGVKYKDIADQMGISVKTVESQMRIAFTKIREAFKEDHALLFLLFK